MSKKIFIVLVSLILFAANVFSYDNLAVHPDLSLAAAEIYNRQATVKLTADQIKWIKQGSIDEDTDPRYINHYYDPTTGKGLNSWDEYMGIKFFATGMAAKAWAQKQDSISGDYSVGAILDNYRNGNELRAYTGVGHILHLIQDMTVPAHTRNDSHAAGDPFEAWAKLEANHVMDLSKASLISVDDLNKLFDQLAFYSNKNFFSKDTIDPGDNKIKLANIKINTDEQGNKALYVEYNGYKILKAIKNQEGYVYDFDSKVHVDYWNLLYPKAVGASAGVIDYFVRQFKQIDEEKNQQSLWEVAKKSLATLWGVYKYGVADYLGGESVKFQEGATNYFADKVKNPDTNPITGGLAGNVVKTGAEVATTLANQLKKSNAVTVEDLLKPKPAGAETGQKPRVLGEKVGSGPAGSGETDIIVLPPAGEKSENEGPGSPLKLAPAAPNFIAFSPGDIIPPDTTILNSPAALSSSSLASFRFVSNEDGVTFQYNLDITDWLTAASELNLAGLSEVSHEIKVRAVDGAGNIDLSPAVFAWQIDLTPPTVTIDAAPPQFASSTAADFQFSSNEIDVSLACSLDQAGLPAGQAGWQTCSASTTLNNLAEGEHSFAVQPTDRAGNVGSSSEYVWIVDLTAPSSTLAALEAEYAATGFSVGWSGEDPSTSSGQASTSGIADFEVEYKINDGEWQSWLATTTASSSAFDLAANPGDTIIFRVRANDQAGNIGAWSAEGQTRIAPPPPPPPPAGTDHLVVSEVQVADNEFVEIYNPTGQDISLSGWHFAYYSSTKIDWSDPYRDKPFPDSALIGARGYYLVGLAGYPVSGAPANSDWQPYATAQFSNSAGTVAIFSGSPASSTLVDAVGWGAVSLKEGTAASAPAAGYSLERKATAGSSPESMSAGDDRLAGNDYDSDDNAADFISDSAITPQNSSNPVEPRVIGANNIAIDNISSISTGWTNSVSWPHTVGGDDACLLVTVHWKDKRYDVSSITFNGGNLARAVTDYGGSLSLGRSSIWYIVNPAVGTHPITVNMTGFDNISLSALSVTGCDQSNPLDWTYHRYAGSVHIDNVIAVHSDNSLIVDALTTNGILTLPDAGQEAIFRNQSAGSSYKFAYEAGIHAMGWSLEGNNVWSHSLLVVRGK